MPRIPVHTIHDAPDGSRSALKRQSERVGGTINIFGAMAHSPAVMNLYDSVETLLADRSSLDQKLRTAIHLTTANVNECDYCQAAYTGAARGAGYSVDETIEIRKGQIGGDGKLTALLAVTRQVAANKGYVDDEVWQAALDAGWTDVELLDGFAETVRTILTNYFNHLAETELDLPPAPALD